MAQGKERVLDEYLVAASRTGDRKAFALLAARWHPKLLAHAWRVTRDREAARDVAQSGWIEIVRGLHRLRDDRAFPAWAYRIISRRCAGNVGEIVRQRALRETVFELPEQEQPDLAAKIDGDRVRAAIAQLPPEQSSALALFYLEEMSVAEVAVALAVPTGTVKTRLLHARRKLRDILEGE